MRFVQNTLAAILASVCLGTAATAVAQYEVLYTFPPSNGNAPQPVGSLRTDAQGNLFGDLSDGSAFELTPGAHGYTERTLPTGPGGADWIPDAKGNFYTAVTGTAPSSGEIVESYPVAGGAYRRRTIYSFGASATDGVGPSGSLVFDVQGNLYGTTVSGGANGAGTVFKLTSATNGTWTEQVLYSFGANSTDAVNPTTGLTIDSAGNLYGTTETGGPIYVDPYYGNVTGGTVYELAHQGNGSWKETILHDFVPSVNDEFGYMSITGDGSYPNTGLVLDNQGNLYGATGNGQFFEGPAPSDTSQQGTIFKLSPTSAGPWTEQVLFLSCENLSDCFAYSNLTIDPAGNLYDTTANGGSNLGVADGTGDTAFKLTPQFAQSVLHNFPAFQTDGRTNGGLTLFHGNLYGVTYDGGPGMNGTVYELQGVASATPVGTVTTITANPNTNLVAGESITLTATVTASSGPAIPTGTVTFVDPAGGSIKVLLVAGKAVFTGKVPPAGMYSVYASYSGDSSFAGSRSSTITDSVRTP